MAQASSIQLYTSDEREEFEKSLMLLPSMEYPINKEDDATDKDEIDALGYQGHRHYSFCYTSSVMEYYSDYLRTPQFVAMVGLPARGKTYISKKLCRYLNWIGFKTKVFNLGDYRRMKQLYTDHTLFESDNEEGVALREECAADALRDALSWIHLGGEIAIIDATNSTLNRRKKLQEFMNNHNFKLFYIESICTDPKLVEHNITEVKISSPDYKDKNPKEAIEDFKKRIENYEKKYATLDETKEPDISFIKLINAGERVEIYKHEGPIQSRIIYYLTSLQLLPRVIYFTRHGESEFNAKNIIGGDCGLTANGEKYAEVLTNFIADMQIPNLRVWTSLLRRTIETAKHFTCPQERWDCLNEINVGVCEGMNHDEIRQMYPGLHEEKIIDKFHFQYPDGESYQDVIERLEPLIMELERESNVLVISHAAVIRCLLGYFLDIPTDQIPHIYVPLHTLIKITPITYGCKVQHVTFPIPCVEEIAVKEMQKKRKKDECQCVYTIM